VRTTIRRHSDLPVTARAGRKSLLGCCASRL
jgi:hypothetical protein